jgi:biopolymer transport protein ExbD
MAAGRKRRSSKVIDIPMSSMIDVVFLLLIYFIWTYKDEIPEAHLQVNLPGPGAEQQGPPPEVVDLEVHPGEYRLRNKTLSLSVITETLENIGEKTPNVTVIIKVNQSALTRELIALLDACQGVGLTNLSVITVE